ncbi:MAG: efflux transporter outer membrane subunit [Lysobacter sp.]
MPSTEFRPHRGLGPVFLAIALGAILAGCASTRGLAPSGHSLDPDSLAANRSLGIEGATNASISDADFPRKDWWTAFGDPQLDALINEALAGTPSLAAADARVRQAIARAGLADAARSPTLGAGAQYSVVSIPSTLAGDELGGETNGSALLTLNFKYSPDLWGGQRTRWQAALGEARAAEVDAQAARLTLASNIAHAYVVLAQAHSARDVAEEEQARSSELLDLGRQRVEAGLDNRLQIRLAEANAASARQQTQAAQQQIDAARNALAALLGQGPDRGLEITPPRLLDAPSPAVPDVLPSELLGHRPDVVAARWRVEAARHGIDASKAAFYPTINLNAIAGLASGGLSDLFGSDALLVYGGPAISLPIFDGGRLRNQLAGSDADYDLAVASYNQGLVGALREVADALQAMRSLDARIASTVQASDAAQSAWDIATARYRAGLGNQIDVLSAQEPLLQFDQQIVALRSQRLDAAIDLDRALGGGLVLAAPTPSTPSDIATAPARNPTP